MLDNDTTHHDAKGDADMPKKPVKHWTALLLVTLAMATATNAYADVDDGIEAFLAGNRIMAWRELLPAAKAGDPEAQFYVGTMYRHGFGTEQDDTEALYWISEAAKQGYAQAEFVLGFDLLQQGERRAAAKYILAAAETGYGTAQYYAGVLYRDGMGVEANAAIALGWILRAAAQDVVEAQYEAGLLLSHPQEGINADLKDAYRWFFIAADRGYPSAAQSRDAIAEVLDDDQLADAREQATAWIRSHR